MNKNVSNLLVILIGIAIVITAIWYFQKDNIEATNTEIIIINVNEQVNVNDSKKNTNINGEILIDTTELEAIEIETDISDLGTIESDLEIPELDFDIAY